MIPDDLQALALADAIGALDPDERRELEARLSGLPLDVRAAVARLYDASVEIASSTIGETPSPGVRNALLTGLPRHPITRSLPTAAPGSTRRCPACG